MSKFFLRKRLSAGKTSILNELFNARADKLAEGKYNIPIENKEKFLDIVANVQNKALKQNLINSYLKDEDNWGIDAGKLIEKYYKARCTRRNKNYI